MLAVHGLLSLVSYDTGWCYILRSLSRAVYRQGFDILTHCVLVMCPGPWFNIKMSSYQYRKSYCADKTVVRSSYLHNGIFYTGKMTSLYWISPLYLHHDWFMQCGVPWLGTKPLHKPMLNNFQMVYFEETVKCITTSILTDFVSIMMHLRFCVNERFRSWNVFYCHHVPISDMYLILSWYCD